jgi:hypothetical protein
MFDAEQKRNQTLASSFLRVEVPAKTAGLPLQVYLTAGDLERAFDSPQFRPHAAIVPTNTELAMTAPFPQTQRVLIDRVRKHPDVMRDLQAQIAARLKPPSGDQAPHAAHLQIGVDVFVARLSRGTKVQQREGAFPGIVCLIPTEFSNGGAIDRRELFTQDRVRTGIAGCLAALDEAGAESLVMPLTGAASSRTQAKDPLYEGQRILRECRLVNAVAGIALGIHDFAATRRHLRDIGIVQWDREISGMFSVPRGSGSAKSAENAYRSYAAQIAVALRKGLDGEKTTASDVYGSCNATFNPQ